MKRFLMLLMALVMLSCPALAEEVDWYLETALEHAGKVGELVKDETYHQLMTSMEFECIDNIKAADFETLISAHRCTLPDEAGIRVLLKAVAGWELSDVAMNVQIATLPELPISLYIGMIGSNELAASTLLRYSRTYTAPENFEPCTYVLEMDGAVVAVAFCETGTDTMTVSAQPLFAKEDTKIDDLLEDFVGGNIPMEIEKVF